MTTKSHTHCIIFGRPPIGGKLPPSPLAAPLYPEAAGSLSVCSPVVVGGRGRREADDQDGGGGQDRAADRDPGDAPVLGDDRDRPRRQAARDGAAVPAADAREVRVHRAARVAAEGNEARSPGTRTCCAVFTYLLPGLLTTERRAVLRGNRLGISFFSHKYSFFKVNVAQPGVSETVTILKAEIVVS